MKNTVLVKHHPSVQLAHLYEHLFLFKANELLNQRGLFKWIDYTLNGTTYEQGGIITVEFKSYNDVAEACFSDVTNIQLSFEDSEVIKALMQLHAEEYYELKQAGYGSIVKHLRDLNDMQWQSLDKLGFWNAKDMRRVSMPLHLANTESKQPITTKVSLELDHTVADANTLTKATFNIIARAVLLTATYNIARSTGSYTFQLYSELSGKRLVAELLTASKYRAQAPVFNEVIDEVRATMELMNQHGALTRLVDTLRNTSYYQHGAQAPDYEQLLSDAGILIGSRGWKELDQGLVDTIKENVTVGVRRSRGFERAPL